MELGIYVLQLRIIERVSQAAKVALPLLRRVPEDEGTPVHFETDLHRLPVPEDGLELAAELLHKIP